MPEMGFPGGSFSKESACNARDPGSIPGSGRSFGEGSGNPLQYSCLEKHMDGGAWLATVYRVSKNRTQLSMCMHAHMHTYSHTQDKEKLSLLLVPARHQVSLLLA